MIMIEASPDITISVNMLGILVTLLIAVCGGILWMIGMLYNISGRTSNNEEKLKVNDTKFSDYDKRMAVHDTCSAKVELKATKERIELIEQDNRQIKIEIQNAFDKYNNQNRENFNKVFDKVDDMKENFIEFIKEFAKK